MLIWPWFEFLGPPVRGQSDEWALFRGLAKRVRPTARLLQGEVRSRCFSISITWKPRVQNINHVETICSKYQPRVQKNLSTCSKPRSLTFNPRVLGGSRDESGKTVFQRLLAGTNVGESERKPGKGIINPYQGRRKWPDLITKFTKFGNKSH